MQTLALNEEDQGNRRKSMIADVKDRYVCCYTFSPLTETSTKKISTNGIKGKWSFM